MTEPQPSIQNLTVQQVLNAKAQEWSLELVAGGGGLQREIATAELNRPGLALAGYYEVFSADRIQLDRIESPTISWTTSPPARPQMATRPPRMSRIAL